MKASVVITVLDSHEIVRRQLLYFDKILPDGAEVVLIDDGSRPQIEVAKHNFPLIFYRTNDFRPWTQAKARMKGINLATSDRLICVDIDHVITKDLISFVMNSNYDFIKFRRKFAVLDEGGCLQTDRETIMAYGVPAVRINRRGLRVNPPGNCYAASRELLSKLTVNPDNHKVRLQALLNRLKRQNGVSICGANERPLIYVIPSGRFCGSLDANPFGLFHGLSREMEEYKCDYWIGDPDA